MDLPFVSLRGENEDLRRYLYQLVDTLMVQLNESIEGLSLSSDGKMMEVLIDLDGIRTKVQNSEGSISTLKQAADEIRTEVSGKIGEIEAQSLIDMTMQNITLAVNSGESGSSISLTSNGVTVTSDQVDLVVDSANIHGKLTIGQLPNTVAELSDIPTDTSELTNGAGFQTPSGVTTIVNGIVTTDFVNALGVKAESIVANASIQSPVIKSGDGHYELTTGDPLANDGFIMRYVSRFGSTEILRIYYDDLGRLSISAVGDLVTTYNASGAGSTLTVCANNLDVESIIRIGEHNYGTQNPISAGIQGVDGQLYFQIVS